MLEAASVAGAEFSPYAVAAALDEEAAAVESTCEELGRRHQFIRDSGVQTLPGGLVVGRFSFVHAVYRNVLYDRISAARRVLLHKRLAVRGEQVYGERASEIAAELAMHFERASDDSRAARYLQVAAANAMRRSAYREAIALSRRGLGLLSSLPDTPDRIRQELQLQLTLGVPLVATEGYAAPAVGEVYPPGQSTLRSAGRQARDRAGALGTLDLQSPPRQPHGRDRHCQRVPAARRALVIRRDGHARALGAPDHVHTSRRLPSRRRALREGDVALQARSAPR